MELEEQWEQFMHQGELEIESKDMIHETSIIETRQAPECTKLKISTKSKIIYLNSTFNLHELFWKLKVIDYDSESEGIIKKQIKFNFLNKSEVEYFETMAKNEKNIKIKILNQVDNPSGRVPFKDVRKVDIGFCKKDILKPKKQSKSAFYNCFVIIFRKFYNGEFREFHVKLFNSGKVEIPGIQSDHMLDNVITILLNTIQPYFKQDIQELKEKRQLVLVNSNFNCMYYLDREKLVCILKKKYNIKCGMDSCSYPGIQCKYKLKNDIEISFMIFRTGSVLIVGKCNDDELNEIYSFLKDLFKNEYIHIHEKESELEKLEKEKIKHSKKKKTKKCYIIYK